jgi:hypothetical protein
MIDRRAAQLAAILVLILAGCNMPLSDSRIESTLEITPPDEGETSLPSPAQITGRVWHDLCGLPSEGQQQPSLPPEGCIEVNGSYQADGIYDQTEPGIMGISVSLGLGNCPSVGLAESVTNEDGVYAFIGIDPGMYCVSVDPAQPKNSEILRPGKWTSNPNAGASVVSLSVSLEPEEEVSGIDFGWDYQLLPQYSPTPTQSPSETTPTVPPSETPEPSETPVVIDADLPADEPDYVDFLINPENWFSGVSSYEDEHVRFEIADSRMKMTAFNPDLYEGWRLSWPVLEDFYIEATFETGECSGRDRYGLFLRASNIEENPHGYLFGLTCDGRYSLRSFDGEFTILSDWTFSDNVSSGSDQTNLVGFWAVGDQIRLYVNGIRLAEIQDATFKEGPYGLFVGAGETESFTVEVDQIAYWTLP